MRAAAAPGVRSAAERCTQTREVGLAGGRGGSEEEVRGWLLLLLLLVVVGGARTNKGRQTIKTDKSQPVKRDERLAETAAHILVMLQRFAAFSAKPGLLSALVFPCFSCHLQARSACRLNSFLPRGCDDSHVKSGITGLTFSGLMPHNVSWFQLLHSGSVPSELSEVFRLFLP